MLRNLRLAVRFLLAGARVHDQIVHLFNTYDEDESGELDMNELRQLMLESDVRRF